MPLQLNVRTNTSSTLGTAAFGQRLGQELSKSPTDGPKSVQDLLTYVQGKGQNAQIRVVNTTKNSDLAFKAKTFGFRTYRKERTAEAIKQLLVRAGVDPLVAQATVDRALKQDNNRYRTATAALIKDILQDPSVQAAIAPANASQGAEAAAVPQQAAPAAPRPAPIQLALKPQHAASIDLISKEFKNKNLVSALKLYPKSDQMVFKFAHASGGRAEFRDLGAFEETVRIRKGKILGDDMLYEDFEKQYPKAQKDLGTPDKYLLQELQEGQAVGPCLLVPRQDLELNPNFADKNFKVLGTITLEDNNSSVAEAPPLPQASASAATDDLAQYEVTGPVPSFTMSASSTNTSQLDAFLRAHELQPGQALGEGSFGAVTSMSHPSRPEPVVTKYFVKHGKPMPVALTPIRQAGALSEGYAAYLESSRRDPSWTKPNIVAPSHYIVGRPQGGSDQLELVPISDLKKTLREQHQNGGPDLKCYGLVMEKAPGQEIGEQMTALSQNGQQRAQCAQSGLETLKTLNARGFVHRDIKPNNLMFDGKNTHFIDTGLLFKIRKQAAAPNLTEDERKAELPNNTAGTLFYMHKDQRAGGDTRVGTQADLHAFGLVTLEMEAPEVFVEFATLNLPSAEDFPMGPKTFIQRLDQVIATAKANGDSKLQQSAEALKRNIQNPNHLAHLGFQCLQKADTTDPQYTALRWADRSFSDGQYTQLLRHPALQRRQGAQA